MLVATILLVTPDPDTSSVHMTNADVPRTCTRTLVGLMWVLEKAWSLLTNMFCHMSRMLRYPTTGREPGWTHWTVSESCHSEPIRVRFLDVKAYARTKSHQYGEWTVRE